ncbi:MAG: hypothetical protein VX252_01845 [Myxococcota bacterium]|nr:hypothetical protein [Myxococcota bacterium]
MSEVQLTPPHSAAELQAQVRAEVEHLDPAWRVIAEGILGLEDRIDLIAIDGRGRIVVILLGLAGEDDRTGLTRLIAQRAWVAERLGDWAQLAPELELDADAPVRGVLMASEFSAQTRASLKELGDLSLELIRYTSLRSRGRPQIVLSPLEASTSPVFNQEAQDPSLGRPKPSGSVFRSGLSEEDLGLASPDARGLEESDDSPPQG